MIIIIIIIVIIIIIITVYLDKKLVTTSLTITISYRLSTPSGCKQYYNFARFRK